MELAIKIFGWTLLIIGIIVIGWTLYSSYNIFTGRAAAPEIFKIEAEEVSVAVQKKVPVTPEELQKETDRLIEEQLKDILPADVLPKMFNLAVWSMLAFILIFGGGQLSTLGIKLIKK